jgi:hypothetical protein
MLLDARCNPAFNLYIRAMILKVIHITARSSTSPQGVLKVIHIRARSIRRGQPHSQLYNPISLQLVNCSVPMPFWALLQPTSQTVTLLLGSTNNLLWFPTEDARFAVILTGDPAVFRGQLGEQPGFGCTPSEAVSLRRSPTSAPLREFWDGRSAPPWSSRYMWTVSAAGGVVASSSLRWIGGAASPALWGACDSAAGGFDLVTRQF